MKAKDTQLSVHRFLPLTESEGPGRRAALWVQGCPIRCPGCFNKDTWSFSGGLNQSVGEVFEMIQDGPPVEGVSFLGGEPFSFAAPLAELARMCRDQGLSVLTFSGHSRETLQKSLRSSWQKLLHETDLLLAGPFLEDRIDLTRPWVGSENQEFVFLTERYSHLRPILTKLPNQLEAHIGEDGSLSLNGLARAEEIAELETELLRLGLNCSFT